MKRFWVVALVLAYQTATAGFMTGNDLLDDMRNVNAQQIAIGYVSGVADRLALQANICIPEGATAGQLHDVVKRYLEAHPEQRHHDASALVSLALLQAFPCRH